MGVRRSRPDEAPIAARQSPAPRRDPRISRRAESYHHPRPLPLASSDHEGRLRNHHSCVAYAPSSLPISLTLSPAVRNKTIENQKLFQVRGGARGGCEEYADSGRVAEPEGPDLLAWAARGALHAYVAPANHNPRVLLIARTQAPTTASSLLA